MTDKTIDTQKEINNPDILTNFIKNGFVDLVSLLKTLNPPKQKELLDTLGKDDRVAALCEKFLKR